MPKRSAGRVIVVGSSNTDLVVHVKKLPSGGETVLGGDMQTFAGGKGANQAVAAARAGAKVHFIGAFGNDAFGKARRADLEREGVDCSGCVVKKGVPSGVALIAIGEGKGGKAENQIVVAPGANMRLTPADVKRGMPKGLSREDVILGSMEVPWAAIEQAFASGVVGATSAILNPAPYPKEGFSKSQLAKISSMVGYITPNEHEFGQFCKQAIKGSFSLKKMLKWFDSHVENVLESFSIVTTLGSQGVDILFMLAPFEFNNVRIKLEGEEQLSEKDQQGLIKHLNKVVPSEFGQEIDGVIVHRACIAAPKVKAVDTVGAGDCFNGCFAARVCGEEFDIEGAARFAVAAASLKVTRHGAQAGMPYRREILKLMKKMK